MSQVSSCFERVNVAVVRGVDGCYVVVVVFVKWLLGGHQLE